MKLEDRMSILETEFKNLKRVIWTFITAVIASMGVQIW